ncbi:YfhD family protein [Paenibacillus sp. 1011MAR3C5]|uniref:YfhD family protein n=1 Tax=Paenibacillus sp. 1011MAR3C5 TaxID=1675787 RepID=UPI000E6C4E34|nr:YfhD family protein [Paenibacillus sp. 1011MAR3C5]RJE89864.1 YfhD family protein [Paenibacillus sp. 1011MAR3C5]
MTNEHNELENVNFGQLPISKNEDVEFSEELADEADRKAQQRAKEADERAQEQ